MEEVFIVYWGEVGKDTRYISVYTDPDVGLEFMQHCEDKGLDAFAQISPILSKPEF